MSPNFINEMPESLFENGLCLELCLGDELGKCMLEIMIRPRDKIVYEENMGRIFKYFIAIVS